MSKFMLIKFDWSDDMQKLDDMIVKYLSECGREEEFERADDKYDLLRLIDTWVEK